MGQVLSGFFIIWLIIAVGYGVGRTGSLGPNAQPVLSRVAFFVASPALLFTTLSESNVFLVLGPQLWIATLSAGLAAVSYLIIARFVVPKRAASERMIAALSASLINSANLGLPIAAYVLGDASYAAPVILFQLAIYTPVYVFVMDSQTLKESQQRDSDRKVIRAGFWRSLGRILATVVRNPLIIGSAFGLVYSITDWQLWQPLDESIQLIGGAAIPAMLLAFGISLVGSKPLAKEEGRRRDTVVASTVKLLIHPLAAWLLAAFVFQLDDEGVLIATVLASLPTAQNVFVSASRYNTGLIVARDTVFVTTILAIPAMIVVAGLLA
ncbi:AEC family transporter [Enteractinococcus fodinae]|uniref:Permease n=1 Tax=Enteractinococcus fodinae TaxID=684663 RepID=A0ABU2AY17_9MICC|nr:AEC family transporter [Enteractinococcus fodinae]MDR7346252.1 putative permease [Enteractinococcus fodinae]